LARNRLIEIGSGAVREKFLRTGESWRWLGDPRSENVRRNAILLGQPLFFSFFWPEMALFSVKKAFYSVEKGFILSTRGVFLGRRCVKFTQAA
jgi:hypothetical protein